MMVFGFQMLERWRSWLSALRAKNVLVSSFISLWSGYCLANGEKENPWHLLRSGSGEILSQSADLTQSDPEIAGLMFTCDNSKLSAIVVVIDPIQRQENIHVIVAVDGESIEYKAVPVAGGAGVDIPMDLPILLQKWRTKSKLRIVLESQKPDAHATFDLFGLNEGISMLRQSCDR